MIRKTPTPGEARPARVSILLVVCLACLVCCGRGCASGRTAGPREAAPPVPVPYYQLRIDLSTTSEKAMLTIEEPEKVLSGRLVSVQGAPFKKGVNMRSVWVAGPPGGGSSGPPLAVTADYAISPEILEEPLSLRLDKSAAGETTVRISNVVSPETAQLLQEIRHAGPGPVAFLFDTGLLGDVSPLVGEVSRAAPSKLVWAFYYPWYSNPWNTAVLLDRPAMGYYDSSARDVIETQVEQAVDAGIDGFVSSWWGPGDSTDENLKRLLDIAGEKGFRVMINFELIAGIGAGGEPVFRSESEIIEWLRYAILNYRDHPAYMNLGGKPVFVMWASYNVAVETWGSILDELRAEGLDALLIAETSGEWPRLDPLEVFAGMHTYNILGIVRSPSEVPGLLTSSYGMTGRGLRHYGLLSGSADAKIWAATVEPGYDDHLQGKTTPILDRDEGCLYRATFEAAVASDPDWIFVTSWNEWWEHTYIEPSALWQDSYLDLTREMARKWKRGEPGTSLGSPQCE